MLTAQRSRVQRSVTEDISNPGPISCFSFYICSSVSQLESILPGTQHTDYKQKHSSGVSGRANRLLLHLPALK